MIVFSLIIIIIIIEQDAQKGNYRIIRNNSLINISPKERLGKQDEKGHNYKHLNPAKYLNQTAAENYTHSDFKFLKSTLKINTPSVNKHQSTFIRHVINRWMDETKCSKANSNIATKLYC